MRRLVPQQRPQRKHAGLAFSNEWACEKRADLARNLHRIRLRGTSMKNAGSNQTTSESRRKARLAEALRSNLSLRKVRSRASKTGGGADGGQAAKAADLNQGAAANPDDENEGAAPPDAFKRPLTEG
jgi:hypothetical protein